MYIESVSSQSLPLNIETKSGYRNSNYTFICYKRTDDDVHRLHFPQPHPG